MQGALSNECIIGHDSANYKYSHTITFNKLKANEMEDDPTIEYIIKNYNNLTKYVRHRYKLPEDEAQEILSDAFLDLKKRETPFEPYLHEDGSTYTAEKFVYNRIDCIYKRKMSHRHNVSKYEVSECVRTTDGQEMSLFDACQDPKYMDLTANICEDFEKTLDMCEKYRYINGVDIYEFLYMFSLSRNWACFKRAFDSLCCTRETNVNMHELQVKIRSIEDVLNLFGEIYKLKATEDGSIKLIRELGKRVYGSDEIRKLTLGVLSI